MKTCNKKTKNNSAEREGSVWEIKIRPDGQDRRQKINAPAVLDRL
jgi:hypothetical protein